MQTLTFAAHALALSSHKKSQNGVEVRARGKGKEACQLHLGHECLQCDSKDQKRQHWQDGLQVILHKAYRERLTDLDIFKERC